MANLLLAYATRQGQTGKVAQRLAAVVAARGHSTLLVDLDHLTRELDPKTFDAVLVAAPIHVGGYPPSVVRFAHRHRDALNGRPTAFVSVGLAVASRATDGRAQTQPIVGQFVRRTGWRPTHVELVAGALQYSKYGFLTRYIMRRITAKEGGDTDTSRDYEYTDWAALERFAEAFAAEVSAAEHALPSGQPEELEALRPAHGDERLRVREGDVAIAHGDLRPILAGLERSGR